MLAFRLSDLAAQATERARAANYVCAPIDSAAILKATEGVKPGDLSKEGAEFIPKVIRAAYERLLKATGVNGSRAPTEERRSQEPTRDPSSGSRKRANPSPAKAKAVTPAPVRKVAAGP